MAKPESSQSQEVLVGLVERVTFHNSDNGFCVLRVKARGHRDLVTVVGHSATISAGEWTTATGEWINDHTHGQQFRAHFLKTATPTSIDGIEKYLGSGMIRGIGPVYAKNSSSLLEIRSSTLLRLNRIDYERSPASGSCAQKGSPSLGQNRKLLGRSWSFFIAMASGQRALLEYTRLMAQMPFR